MVRVGHTTLALRRREAQSVWVQIVPPPSPHERLARPRSLPAPQLSLSLIGVPNCGKTALFNRLTGRRQKVANYPGVTVERKEGAFFGPRNERIYQLIDLPGTYSLVPTTLDEAITRDLIHGKLRGEATPELLVCVVDATNLRLSLRLVLELRLVRIPMIVALNMSDCRRAARLPPGSRTSQQELGVAVVATVAVRSGGVRELIEAIDRRAVVPRLPQATLSPAVLG